MRLHFVVAALVAAACLVACRGHGRTNDLALYAADIESFRVLNLPSSAQANVVFSTRVSGLDATGLVRLAERGIANELEARIRRLTNARTLKDIVATGVREDVEPFFTVDDKAASTLEVQLIEYGVLAGQRSGNADFYAVVDARIVHAGLMIWETREVSEEPLPTNLVPGGLGNLAAVAGLEDVHIQEGIERAVRSAAGFVVQRIASDRAARSDAARRR